MEIIKQGLLYRYEIHKTKFYNIEKVKQTDSLCACGKIVLRKYLSDMWV